MKTDKELMLVGLKEHRKDIQRLIKNCFEEYAKEAKDHDLSVSDLDDALKDVTKMQADLSEVNRRIIELDPPGPEFAADDIPF